MPRGTGERRKQILEALALELESNPGTRITTARLAGAIGVSEAALYRHFPSKARMFEGLIEFAEETVFGLANQSRREGLAAAQQCERMLRIILGFGARNPGITRVLCGDALVGEHERLRARTSQFFERCETHVKQVLREFENRPGQRLCAPVSVCANMIVAYAEGRLAQFCRSEFKRLPDADLDHQWRLLAAAVFGSDDARLDPAQGTARPSPSSGYKIER